MQETQHCEIETSRGKTDSCINYNVFISNDTYVMYMLVYA